MMAKTSLLARMLMLSPLLAPGLAAAHGTEAHFDETAFVNPPEVVACVLEDGTETTCDRYTVGYLPEGLEIGPFCPATIDDAGGIWEWTGEDAGLYRVDRAFLEMMDRLGYRFFDDSGAVNIIDTLDGPMPDVNTCINVAGDESVVITMLLPVDPVMAETPTDLGTVAKVGVALDGVPIFADAPSIQSTGNMPALDLCGGHIDPGGWYHWHATATDIDTAFHTEGVSASCGLPQDRTALFGYGFDGFAIYGSAEFNGDAPTGLDACNGHIGATSQDGAPVYHYHASESFPNLPGCLVGKQARDNFATTAQAGIGAPRTPGGAPGAGGHMDGAPDGPPPGFEQAAETLGVSPEDLASALMQAGGPPPDFAAAATALGVSEEALRAALPPPPAPR